MPETKQRMIVDGVEFGQLFQFPQMLRAITWAFGPSRLLIALFIVVALVAMGRLWDSMTVASVHPDGLSAGRAEQGMRDEHQDVLRGAMRRFGPEEATEGELKTNDVLREIADGYQEEREQLRSEDDREVLQGRYESTLDDIENTRPHDDFEATVAHVAGTFSTIIDGVFSLDLQRTKDGVVGMLVATPLLLWQNQTWFAIFYGLVVVVIMAIGGGALSRMAALHFAGGEQLRVREAIDFALARWGRLVWAAVLPLLIAAILCGVVIVMGLLMEVPVLDVVGGVMYGLALILGFLITFLLVGYWLGFPMLTPAVACENCDGADAMQRAYAYVVSRPLHLLAYWLLALVGLALGFLLVSVIATLTLNITKSLFDVVTDNSAIVAAGVDGPFDLMHEPRPVTGSWHNHWAGTAIAFWQSLVLSLVVAYIIAYFFGAATIMYLLMRRVCDGQDIQEVWRPGLMAGTMAPAPAVAPVSEARGKRAKAKPVEASEEGLD